MISIYNKIKNNINYFSLYVQKLYFFIEKQNSEKYQIYLFSLCI